MAIFQYIEGNKVKNAVGYRLKARRSKDVNAAAEILVTRDVQLQMDIVGTIGDGGAPAENENVIYTSGGANAYTPITKMGDYDYEYYYRIKGKINVTVASPEGATLPLPDRIVDIPFNAVFNVNSAESRWVKFPSSNYFEINYTDKAIYLTLIVDTNQNPTKTQKVKIYDISGLPEGVKSSDIELGSFRENETPSIAFYGTHPNYRRTDYIPISCLTDDVNGHCVGLFREDTSSSLPGYKIAFYDKDLKFLDGVYYNEINADYLSVQDITRLAPSGAVYAIFSSRTTDGYFGEKDVVSVGGVYIPLLNTRLDLPVESGDWLSVQAVGDGVFFKDSPETFLKEQYTPVS